MACVGPRSVLFSEPRIVGHACAAQSRATAAHPYTRQRRSVIGRIAGKLERDTVRHRDHARPAASPAARRAAAPHASTPPPGPPLPPPPPPPPPGPPRLTPAPLPAA